MTVLAGSHHGTDPTYLQAVAVPPTELSATLGGRVEHILVNEPGVLSEVVACALDLPQVRSDHCDHVSPVTHRSCYGIMIASLDLGAL